MLDKNHIHDIFDRIRRFSSADEVEMIVLGGSSALTRFANNTIHQNVADENYSVSIRTVFNGKTARATTNKLDEDSLRRAVQSAEALTKIQEPDPDLLPMAGKEVFPPANDPSRYFEQTAALTPEARAEGVRKMVEIAKKHGLTTAGIFSNATAVEAVINSNGLFAYHTQTSAEISVTMLDKDSSGWQKQNSPDVANLDPGALAETAALKAVLSRGPREVPAGKYSVVLEPAAVLDIVGFMFWDFGGLSLLDQRSFLNKRIGKKLFGENITIRDDAYHPLQSGPAFDGEGVRRKRLSLVENGVIKEVAFARGTAARFRKSELASELPDASPTGHGFPLPNEMGEMPMNIVFDLGTTAPKSVEQMIAETERGILVTRLWYIREVEPYEKMLTGMTRDGTFLIENGKVQHGVRNFRFNESLVHMLSNVEAMSTPVRASGEESFDMVVPAMKVRDFNFTEVTKF